MRITAKCNIHYDVVSPGSSVGSATLVFAAGGGCRRWSLVVSMKALDLFCGGGGAALGLSWAGYEVVGVDISPQPEYPYMMHQADALSFSIPDDIDLVWASPPCQRYCSFTRRTGRELLPDLIAETRQKLKKWGGPYIIENVCTAPLENKFLLCGSMFNLGVRRHRCFESNLLFLLPAHIGCSGRNIVTVAGHSRGTIKQKQEAMGIPHIRNRHTLNQAIPPAYSRFLASQVVTM